MVIPMRKITIDCSGLTRPQLHEAFARAFSFPQWYGNNLDALYDCLTDIQESTHLIAQSLNDRAFSATLLEASLESKALTVTLE